MGCPGALSAMLVAYQVASPVPVTIATEGDYPPYVTVSETGDISGFEKEVADDVCLRAALDCTWIFAQFDQLLPGVMAGTYDIAIGGIAITEDRLANVDFTISYNKAAEDTLYYGRDSAPEPDVGLIGVQSGTIFEMQMQKMGRKYRAYATAEAMGDALVAGEVDLVLGASNLDILQSGEFVSKGSESIPDLGTAMAICKGNEIKTKIDMALREMMADGTLDAITNRWF
ncbi:MAG: transporter substrate-binding domain-containing protein [Deltaproteobacteria bacterium]